MNNNFKWKHLKNAVMDNIEEDVFLDITYSWIEFIKKDKYLKKNSFILWDLGGRGSGKTSDTFKLTNILLKDNNKRVVQFWKVDKSLIDHIEESCPDELKGRYETIKKLREIKLNSIFVIDEGLLGANAKEALRIEMKNLIKFISKSRHLNIIGVINSVSLGILLQFKSVIDIIIYKRLPKMFVKENENRDIMIKEYAESLPLLKDWQGIIVSSYKKFTKEGLISWKYENYCPWFNDDISMYQRDVNPDVDFDDEVKKQKEHIEFVEFVIKKKGFLFMEKGGYRNFRMWLYTNHLAEYYDFKKDLKTIYELYLHTLEHGNAYKIIKDSIQEKYGDDLTSIIDDLNIKSESYNFSNVEKDAVNKFLEYDKTKNKGRNLQIYLESFSKEVKEIAVEFDLSTIYIYNIINSVRGNLNKKTKKYPVGSINYYKGKLFEKEYKKFLDSIGLFDYVELNGNSGEPDIVAYSKGDTNTVYVMSLKNLDIEKTGNLYPKDLDPEIQSCRKFELSGNKVFMIIVVLNNVNNKVYATLYDYNTKQSVSLKFFKN